MDIIDKNNQTMLRNKFTVPVHVVVFLFVLSFGLLDHRMIVLDLLRLSLSLKKKIKLQARTKDILPSLSDLDLG